jgi:endonuclease/exonuclease/phosphatase family metal-dependent hydrolase
VATYNIRAGLGGIQEITQDLRALSADVIALQEVERGVYGSRSIDQAPTIATALGMSFAFSPSFSLEGREHGIAVLSRFPIVASETVELPRGSGRWPRVALKTRIETPFGPMRMVCIHLTRPWRVPFSHTRERLAQLGVTFEHLEGDSLAVVMAGDFNSTPISPERWLVSRHLRDSWVPWRDGWATTFSLQSIGFPWGSVKIDAIYHDAHWKSRGIWVAPLGGSDHRAVVADLAPKTGRFPRSPVHPPGS